MFEPTFGWQGWGGKGVAGLDLWHDGKRSSVAQLRRRTTHVWSENYRKEEQFRIAIRFRNQPSYESVGKGYYGRCIQNTPVERRSHEDDLRATLARRSETWLETSVGACKPCRPKESSRPYQAQTDQQLYMKQFILAIRLIIMNALQGTLMLSWTKWWPRGTKRETYGNARSSVSSQASKARAMGTIFATVSSSLARRLSTLVAYLIPSEPQK